MVSFQPFWAPGKPRKSRFLAAFLPPLFLEAFVLENCCFKDSFSAFSERAKNDASAENNAFLVHFLRTIQQFHVMQNPAKKRTKNSQTLTKIQLFGEPV